MKFPRLSDDELKSLESEFISFLVVQGLDDASWRILNEKEPLKAQGIVDLFSKVVWEKVIHETRYLNRISDDEQVFIYVGDKQGEMIFVQKDEHDNSKCVIKQGRKTWNNNRSEMVMDFFIQGFVRCSQEEYINFKNQLIR